MELSISEEVEWWVVVKGGKGWKRWVGEKRACVGERLVREWGGGGKIDKNLW